MGTIDDFVIDPNSVWSGTFTLPTERYRITSTDSRVNIIKFDRQHDKRGDYSAFSETTHTKALKFTETSGVNINTLSNPVVTIWNQGSSGLQILDYSDVISQLAPGSYNFTSASHTFASKTSTIPSPLGRKVKAVSYTHLTLPTTPYV